MTRSWTDVGAGPCACPGSGQPRGVAPTKRCAIGQGKGQKGGTEDTKTRRWEGRMIRPKHRRLPKQGPGAPSELHVVSFRYARIPEFARFAFSAQLVPGIWVSSCRWKNAGDPPLYPEQGREQARGTPAIGEMRISHSTRRNGCPCVPFLTCTVRPECVRYAAYSVSPKSMRIIDAGDPGLWGEFPTQQGIKHFQA